MGSEDHPRPNSQAGSEGTSALRSHAGTYPRTIFIDLRVQRSCMKNSQGKQRRTDTKGRRLVRQGGNPERTSGTSYWYLVTARVMDSV